MNDLKCLLSLYDVPFLVWATLSDVYHCPIRFHLHGVQRLLVANSAFSFAAVVVWYTVPLVYHTFTDFLVSKTNGSSLLRMIPNPTLETS